MKRSLALLSLLALAACVDTTGLSSESSKMPAGNPLAVVVVTEFADLECPACRSANDLLKKPLLEKYATQIRYEYKHFPLRALHRYAMDLAEAAECAADQGKFWEFVDAAFEHQDEVKQQGKEAIDAWGETLGLDTALFDRCRQSHIKKDAVNADYEEGRTAGVMGTPTFFVSGVQTEATIDALSAAIDAQLQGATQRL